MALVVLLVALVGALGGLIAAAHEFHDGQVRQAKMALVEAKSQRLMMASRGGSLFTGAGQASSYPQPNSPETYAKGTSPWVIDPDASICPSGCATTASTDLSTGAFFDITPDGKIVHNPGTWSDCAAAATAAPSVYCREIAVLQGLEDTAFTPGGSPQGVGSHQAYTIWIRVSRGSESLSQAVIQRDVWVQ